jgi:hypothetical protein
MLLRDLQPDDLALLGSVVIASVAVLIGEVYSSTWFKGLKILAVLVSLGMALYRLKIARPFAKDIPSSSMVKTGQYFQCTVPKGEHGRGKYATARCLTPNDAGGYSECYADASGSTQRRHRRSCDAGVRSPAGG